MSLDDFKERYRRLYSPLLSRLEYGDCLKKDQIRILYRLKEELDSLTDTIEGEYNND